MKRNFTIFINDIIESINSISEFINGKEYENFANDDKTLSAVLRKIGINRRSSKEYSLFYN